MEQLVEIWYMIPEELRTVSAVIGLLSAIATITPTPKDDVILIALRKILNLGAMNIGKSENADKPPSIKEALEKRKQR